MICLRDEAKTGAALINDGLLIWFLSLSLVKNGLLTEWVLGADPGSKNKWTLTLAFPFLSPACSLLLDFDFG